MNEMELLDKQSQRTLRAIKAIAKLVEEMVKDATDSHYYKKRTKALMRITHNGTMEPYMQTYGSDQTELAYAIQDRIEQYNKYCPKSKRIDYMLSKTTNGQPVFWTNQNGIEKIEQIRMQMARERGVFYSEVTPSELYKDILSDPSQNRFCVEIEGLTENDIHMIKDKNIACGSDYPIAVSREKGSPKIIVKEHDFINIQNKRDDLFTDVLRSKMIQGNDQNHTLEKEKEYHDQMIKGALRYDNPNPTYITSALNGGEYIKLTDKGFSKYSVFSNGADTRQFPVKKVNRKSMSAAEYEKELYEAITSMVKPVEINQKVVKEHEKAINQFMGKGGISAYKESAKQFIRQSLDKTGYVSNPGGIQLSKTATYFSTLAKNGLANEVAAIAIREMVGSGRKINDKNIKTDITNNVQLKRGLRREFLTEQMSYEDPVLADVILKELQKNSDYVNLTDALNNPKLSSNRRAELNKELGSVTEKCFQEINNPKIIERFNQSYEHFADEIIGNATLKASNIANDSQMVEHLTEGLKKLQKESKNEALNVVITQCVTGKVLSGIRPFDTDPANLERMELIDEMTSAYAKEIRKELSRQLEGKERPDELLFCAEYRTAVKQVNQDLKQALQENQLEERYGADFNKLYVTMNENGMEVTKTWDEISDMATKMVKLDIVKEKTTEKSVENAVTYEMMHSGEYEHLSYEHNMEMINAAMTNSAKVENISLASKNEKLKTTKKREIGKTHVSKKEKERDI